MSNNYYLGAETKVDICCCSCHTDPFDQTEINILSKDIVPEVWEFQGNFEPKVMAPLLGSMESNYNENDSLKNMARKSNNFAQRKKYELLEDESGTELAKMPF